MVSVGFGDITPVTNIEKIYIIIMTTLSSCIFAYIINIVGSIFKNIADAEAKLK